MRYGIGYKCPVQEGPGAYACGAMVTSLSNVLARQKERKRLTGWLNEMQREQRYLTGLFRGAYPANILSQRHVELLETQAHLKPAGIGRLSPLPNGLSLWEIPDSEIARVEKVLHGSGLLIGTENHSP
jgi:hypothetical protein